MPQYSQFSSGAYDREGDLLSRIPSNTKSSSGGSSESRQPRSPRKLAPAGNTASPGGARIPRFAQATASSSAARKPRGSSGYDPDSSTPSRPAAPRWNTSGPARPAPVAPAGYTKPSSPAHPGVAVSSPSGREHDGERVKVIVRPKPAQEGEEDPGAVEVKEDGRIVIHRTDAMIPYSEFQFDHVLGHESTQHDVYEIAVRPVVKDVLEGYNGTVLAYGQTGSGKTYTLSSIEPQAIGMMPRAAAEIFYAANEDVLHDYSVKMSYIQIYMELVKDLLEPSDANLHIREHHDGSVYVDGVTELEVKTMQDCLHLLQLGDRNRVYAFTKMNAHSSRSHCIVMLTVTKRRKILTPHKAADKDGNIAQHVTVGKLFLVDLAGSERLKKSQSTGVRANEAKHINLSLTMLGMCINARADPTSTHVPFRDSKLTRLLQESLGGNAKTSMVVCVSDLLSNAEETLQTLQFGTRAMCVRQTAVINEHIDYRNLADELMAKLDQREDSSNYLQAQLLEKEEHMDALSAQLGREREAANAIASLLEQEKIDFEKERARIVEEKDAEVAQKHTQLEAKHQELQTTMLELASHKVEKEQLIEQLNASQALYEEMTATHKQEVVSLQQQLREAHAETTTEREKRTAAAELAASEADEMRQVMEALKAAHAEEMDAARTIHEESTRVLTEQHAAALEEIQEVVNGMRMAQEATLAELDAEQEAHGKARDAIDKLADEKVALEKAMQMQKAASDDTASKLSEELAQLRELLAKRDSHIVILENDLEASRKLGEDLMSKLESTEEHRIAMLNARVGARKLQTAAIVIQRAFRRYKICVLTKDTIDKRRELNAANRDISDLKSTKQTLEQQQQKQLAWTGRQLIMQTLSEMETCAGAVIETFLWPSKDLKAKRKSRALDNKNRRMQVQASASALSPQPRLAGAASAAQRTAVPAVTPLRGTLSEMPRVASPISDGTAPSTTQSGNLSTQPTGP